MSLYTTLTAHFRPKSTTLLSPLSVKSNSAFRPGDWWEIISTSVQRRASCSSTVINAFISQPKQVSSKHDATMTGSQLLIGSEVPVQSGTWTQWVNPLNADTHTPLITAVFSFSFPQTRAYRKFLTISCFRSPPLNAGSPHARLEARWAWERRAPRVHRHQRGQPGIVRLSGLCLACERKPLMVRNQNKHSCKSPLVTACSGTACVMLLTVTLIFPMASLRNVRTATERTTL